MHSNVILTMKTLLATNFLSWNSRCKNNLKNKCIISFVDFYDKSKHERNFMSEEKLKLNTFAKNVENSWIQ